jgi:hypothetical protein
MCPDVPYFIILLCLTPDDFTRHGESAATQWVTSRFNLASIQPGFHVVDYICVLWIIKFIFN